MYDELDIDIPTLSTQFGALLAAIILEAKLGLAPLKNLPSIQSQSKGLEIVSGTLKSLVAKAGDATKEHLQKGPALSAMFPLCTPEWLEKHVCGSCILFFLLLLVLPLTLSFSFFFAAHRDLPLFLPSRTLALERGNDVEFEAKIEFLE